MDLKKSFLQSGDNSCRLSIKRKGRKICKLTHYWFATIEYNLTRNEVDLFANFWPASIPTISLALQRQRIEEWEDSRSREIRVKTTESRNFVGPQHAAISASHHSILKGKCYKKRHKANLKNFLKCHQSFRPLWLPPNRQDRKFR